MKSNTRLPEPVFTVQEWLAHPFVPTHNNKPLRYAMWWISMHLAPAQERVRYLDFDGGHLLYVTIRGTRYRVTHIDRFGILTLIDLTDDYQRPISKYPMRSEADFTDWSNTPEGPLNESKFVPYDGPATAPASRLHATH